MKLGHLGFIFDERIAAVWALKVRSEILKVFIADVTEVGLVPFKDPFFTSDVVGRNVSDVDCCTVFDKTLRTLNSKSL